jgi:hypothetical protein
MRPHLVPDRDPMRPVLARGVGGPLVLLACLIGAPGCLDDPNGGAPAIPDPHARDEAPELPVYEAVVEGIERARLSCSADYDLCSSDAERAAVLERAGATVVGAVADGLFPQWYETPWNFYGTTETPRQGSIACGYFVSTILRDAGFRVERERLAQQASELIIKTLTSERYIKRFSDVPLASFVEAIREWGPGLYVVGLDIHTGFMLLDGEEVWFVHSSYVQPAHVVKEAAASSIILGQSRYRVAGRISADHELMLKWLKGQALPTRGR